MFPDRFGVDTEGDVVLVLKSFFNGRAYGNGPVLSNDALYDAALEAHVRLYQREENLPQTGEIDLPTRQNMLSEARFNLVALAHQQSGVTVFVWRDGSQRVTLRWSREMQDGPGDSGEGDRLNAAQWLS